MLTVARWVIRICLAALIGVAIFGQVVVLLTLIGFKDSAPEDSYFSTFSIIVFILLLFGEIITIMLWRILSYADGSRAPAEGLLRLIRALIVTAIVTVSFLLASSAFLVAIIGSMNLISTIILGVMLPLGVIFIFALLLAQTRLREKITPIPTEA